MLKIVALEHSARLDDLLFGEILSLLHEQEREIVRRFRRRQDAERSLLGNLILRATVCDQYKVKNADLDILRTETGKPYANSIPQAFFNISHSGRWIAGAFDSFPVGIDIERMKALDLELCKSALAAKTYEELLERSSPDRLKYFYKCWTMGESYQKMLGSGLTLPLQSPEELCDKAFFNSFPIDEEYMLTVCSTHGAFPEHIVFTDIRESLKLIKLTNETELYRRGGWDHDGT